LRGHADGRIGTICRRGVYASGSILEGSKRLVRCGDGTFDDVVEPAARPSHNSDSTATIRNRTCDEIRIDDIATPTRAATQRGIALFATTSGNLRRINERNPAGSLTCAAAAST
jgi:hypothetical protein